MYCCLIITYIILLKSIPTDYQLPTILEEYIQHNNQDSINREPSPASLMRKMHNKCNNPNQHHNRNGAKERKLMFLDPQHDGFDSLLTAADIILHLQ